MIRLYSSDLVDYLESEYDWHIVGCIDLDWIIQQPRKTLFKILLDWYKPSYKANERIILYSRRAISRDMMTHIQKCTSRIDISNSFVLLCGPNLDHDYLDTVRTLHSTDDKVMTTFDIDFLDPVIDCITENKSVFLPQSFCFRPWAHLEISSKGEFRPCCVFKESVKNTNGDSYNINDHTVDEVYNSEYLISLRKKFLAGDRPSECSACWYKEESGGSSERHWFTDSLGLKADLLDVEQTQSINNLVSLDLKLGNLCNFKCRICNPESSSRIAEERVKHFESKLDLKSLMARGKWADNEKIWKMFNQLANQLINIDFYGGEPFLIKQHEIFLDYLIHIKKSGKIRLHYNSNGSVYPKHMFGKWKNFRQVDIAFSIDDIGQRFEFQRGGKWEQIQKNLLQFQKHQLPNMVLSVFTTINVQNVYYLDELLDWFETNKFNGLTFSILEDPDFMSIFKMGPDLTDLVITKLNKIDKHKLHRYNIFPIIHALKTNQLRNNLNETAKFMKKLDDIRHEDFCQTHPEIAPIIYQGKLQ